jgi:hypothetical protein
MSGIETRCGADDDAERIRSAFYGFVQAHGADVCGSAHLRTEIAAQGQQRLMPLRRVEAMDPFLHGLSTGRPERRRFHE